MVNILKTIEYRWTPTDHTQNWVFEQALRVREKNFCG